MAAIVVIAKDPLPVVAAVHDVVTRFLASTAACAGGGEVSEVTLYANPFGKMDYDERRT